MPEITAATLDALPTSAPSFANSTTPPQTGNLFAALLAEQITPTQSALAVTQAVPTLADQPVEPENVTEADGSGELIAGALLFVPLPVPLNPTPLQSIATSTNPVSQVPSQFGSEVEMSVGVTATEAAAARSNGLTDRVTNQSIAVPNLYPELSDNPTQTTTAPVAMVDPRAVNSRSIPLPKTSEHTNEEAVRTANGPPSIVLQTPVVADRSLAPPAIPVAVSSDPFRLPLTEPAAVSGTAPVSSDTASAIQTALRASGYVNSSSEASTGSVPAGFQSVLDVTEGQQTRTPEPGWNPVTSGPLSNATPPPTGPRSADTAPPLSSQMADGIVTHARLVEHADTHEFHLRLDPAELGEVKVRLLSMGDRVQAEVTVSSDAVRGLIESQLPDLKQRLEAAGLTVSKFDVNTQTGGGSNPQRTPNQSNPWEPPAGGIFPSRTPPMSLPAPTTVLVGGTLDVTA